MPALILRFFDDPGKRLVIPDPESLRLNSSITSPLALPIVEQRFCPKCLSQQTFVVDRDCEFGLVGNCQGCGDEFFRPFTRTTTEVA